jgi:hypothetical protein
MRGLKLRTALWLLAAAAAVGYLALLVMPQDGQQCSSKSCTYVDMENGQTTSGRCGRKPGDDLNCYCFRVDASESVTDRAPAQPQSGCRE